jgi:2-polyprenyl-6-methoxyphenol hydroxylase-like FAD-dependent oxidoreductase
MSDATVLVVGGGFAGITCAQQLAKHDVNVILLDRNKLPPIPAVAVSSRHRATRRVRHRPATARDLPPPRER